MSEQKIVDIFKNNVYGKQVDSSQHNSNHDGTVDHWLEKQMGIKPNAKNESDLLGFEMKNQTSTKTNFGDWSPTYFIFDNPYIIQWDTGENSFNRRNKYFLPIFGKPNEDIDHRLFWSGSVIPKINQRNQYGCILKITAHNDIEIQYSYSFDNRTHKSTLVPEVFQKEDLVIARWSANKMRQRVNQKFNQNSWFRCKTDGAGKYIAIEFGEALSFEKWIRLVKKGAIFFDSGMYESNLQPYSNWHANNSLWDSLVVRSYTSF